MSSIRGKWERSQALVVGRTLPLPERLVAIAEMLAPGEPRSREKAAVDFSLAVLDRISFLAWYETSIDLSTDRVGQRLLLFIITDAICQKLRVEWEETCFLSIGVLGLGEHLAANGPESDPEELAERAARADSQEIPVLVQKYEALQFYEEKMLKVLGQRVVDWLMRDGEESLLFIAKRLPQFLKAVGRC